MMLGGQDRIGEPGLPGRLHPFLRIVFVRIPFLGHFPKFSGGMEPVFLHRANSGLLGSSRGDHAGPRFAGALRGFDAPMHEEAQGGFRKPPGVGIAVAFAFHLVLAFEGNGRRLHVGDLIEIRFRLAFTGGRDSKEQGNQNGREIFHGMEMRTL